MMSGIKGGRIGSKHPFCHVGYRKEGFHALESEKSFFNF